MDYQKAKEYLLKKKNIQEVKDFLTKASEAYYNTDSLILSDTEYDELYKAYVNLTGDKFIGAKPLEGSKTVSVEHDYDNLVGTLDKAKNLEEVKPFLDRYRKIKLEDDLFMQLSLKFDGNSVTIEYDKDGNPKKALTRGQDGKGKDIINVFKDDSINMNGFNLSMLDSEFAIKYEMITTYSDFDKLCEENDISLANPRSAVSGLLNKNDGYKFRKYITMIPLEMRVKEEGFAFDDDGYKKLYFDEIEEAFPENYFNKYTELTCPKDFDKAMKKIEEYYNHVNEIRSSLPFMIDGIVIQFLNKEIIDKYFYDPRGFVPQYSFAVKLPYLEHVTTVTDIDYCCGNTGRITPRIWFDPVKFNGTTHTKQQISNYKRFKELNLGVGSKIMVSYHNDCLSYITKVDNQPKGIKPFEFIKTCPLCGEPIEITINDKGETTLAQCINDNCIGRLKGKIENYFKAMSIKGIKMNTIDDLYDNKLITDIPSLYSIDYKKVAKLLGPKIAQNIQKAIEEKEYYDYEILGSLSINGFNIESAKLLCKKYSLDEIIDFYNENKLKTKMLEIEGFAEISTNYFIEGLKNNESTVEFLYSRGFKVYKDNFKDVNNEINICVTGWRPDPMLDLKLTANGFKVKSSVSKKVNILVYSGEPGATKTNKAKELGIEMMSKEEFLKKYNLI